MIINDLFNNKKPTVAESMAGKVVFSGTGANGGTYEIIQSSPTDFMIHANGKHIDTYGSLQRAMSVLKNEVPGLQQGVAEATGDEKFDTMMGQIQKEPKYPDSQMPPTDVKDLYQWAVENNKLYHEIFAEWANREGYKSVAPALQRAGDLDTEALDYWTPRVWKIYWGEVRGIDSEMPPEWAKKRVPDELRDYLETVFDAYNRIVFDWPTEYRQIGQQGMAEDIGDLGYNVVRYYEKTQEVKKLTNWLEKEAGLPRNSPLYFDDVDLVYGNKTIVSGALINPKLTFNDLLTAVVQASKQGMAEAQTDYQKRRQRERDVDAGKPVKPEPKNPQNDYFARRKKEKDLAEVSLGDYRKKAAVSQAGAKINRFFGRDDAAKVAAADQTIANRTKGLARADARVKPYTPPKFDAEKYQRDLTAKYPNIDQLVADAERNRDPYYDRAEGSDYYVGREAEQLYQRLKQIQRVIQGLNESQIKENKIKLKEAILIEDPIYRTWKTLGQTLVERRMSEKEILQVFADAEAGMTDRATGANRTMLGRGKDVTVDFAKDLSGAVTGILDSLQNDTPISSVDVAYDRATDALAKLSGGQKGKVMQAIKGYRNLVKQYPKTAGFAKAALVAITGLATGGAGLPAVAGLTYALDSAIRGDKLSSVIGKGAGAAFLAWLASSIGSGASQTATADTGVITGPTTVPPVADLPTYTVQPGDNLSTLADRFGTSVRELRGLNPQLAVDQNSLGGQMANPDFIKPGQQLVLPAATGDSVYAGGVGTSANTMSQIGQGNIPDSAISQRMAMRESIRFVTPPLNKIIDRDRTAESWVINESRYQGGQRSVVLTAMGAYAVFENVDRYRQFVLEKVGKPGSTRPKYYRPDMPDGPGKASKPGIIGRGLNWLDKKAKAAGGAISNFSHQFTTDVTKEKLKMNWHQKGKPSDSDELAAWLVTQGVPPQVVTDIYAKMKIPYTPSQAAVAQPGTTEPTAAAEPKKYKQVPSSSGIINAATGRGYTPDELGAEYPDFDFDREEKQAEPKPPGPTPAPTPVTVKGQPPGFTASNLAQQPGMAQYMQPKPTAPATKPAPNFAQGPAGYKTTTTTVAPTTTKTTAAAAPAGKKPTARQQQEYYKSLGLSEDLTWSRNFDPGRSLYRKMKQDR